MMTIYKIIGNALTDAKASQKQAHLAFVMLEIKGLASALNYIEKIKERNRKLIRVG